MSLKGCPCIWKHSSEEPVIAPHSLCLGLLLPELLEDLVLQSYGL